jgi:glycolate oxidase FAD binding subunit
MIKLQPTTFEEAASTLASASAAGQTIRVRGGGTKLGWGTVVPGTELEMRTAGLGRILEHNVGDLTAILEAGVPLAAAQDVFAAAGQMLALDPPLGGNGSNRAATIGGIVATADSGPLRHRYGAPRDLVVGVTVGLSDGTIARSGGKVIKNVAGYDLPKLFAGSFGTLGAILSVSVRLHPMPPATATALGTAGDATVLADAARALAGAPLELEALDVAWRGGQGGLLAQVGGAEPGRRAQRVAARMREAGLERVAVTGDDAGLWAQQRAGQRSDSLVVVRVAAPPTALPGVLAAVDACSGALVGRGALGISYVGLEPEALGRFFAALPAGAVRVLLDAPDELRASADVWGRVDPGVAELMRRIKLRFDPAGACNPGVFAAGI